MNNPNKVDIMQRVAFCGVPQGSYLRQDGPPGLEGVLIAKITPGDGSNGLEVVRARLFYEGLESIMSDMGPAPDAAMLRRLHEGCIQMTRGAIASLTIVELAEQLAEEHRAKVREIGEIARELSLAYDQPQDPFLLAA